MVMSKFLYSYDCKACRLVYHYVSMTRIIQIILLNPIMETAGTNQF